MRRLIAAVLLLAATSAFADAADAVRQSEIAFAKAFADRDEVAFFGFVAADANFLSAKGTLAGKSEVVKKWSGFFAERALIWPKLSRIPSFVRIWLAVMTSWIRASSGSLDGLFSA